MKHEFQSGTITGRLWNQRSTMSEVTDDFSLTPKYYLVVMTIRIGDSEITARHETTQFSMSAALVDAGRRVERLWPNCDCLDADCKELSQSEKVTRTVEMKPKED